MPFPITAHPVRAYLLSASCLRMRAQHHMRACDAETVILATADAEREIKTETERYTHAPRGSAIMAFDRRETRV